ncbi:MAG: acetate--CoA ligase family protein [Candidatus Bruticola sp.]
MISYLTAAQVLAQEPSLSGAEKALKVLGLRFPNRSFYHLVDGNSCEFTDSACVLKVVRPFIAHKTEVKAVMTVDKLNRAVMDNFIRTASANIGAPVEEVAIEEKITINEGGEALLSLVGDPGFGLITAFGEGGRLTELRHNLQYWLPSLKETEIAAILRQAPLAKLWFDGYRGLPPLTNLEELSQFLYQFGRTAEEFHQLRPDLQIKDWEINPLVFTQNGLTALDLLFSVQHRQPSIQTARPNLHKLAHSMHSAKTVAVAGCSVSDSNSLGRVVYDRLKKSFKGQTWAINPKGGAINGDQVYQSISDLPLAPDVLVLALSSRFTAPSLKEAYAKFGSTLGTVLMLASGFDETSGGHQAGQELKAAVASLGDVPILGPNTMALYSQTGSAGDIKIDFLPEGRVSIGSFPEENKNNTALILQSGARFASFLDCQPHLGFRWSIMVGNAYQTDVADGLAMAADDPGVKVVAAYLEGLHPQAGLRLVEAVRRCRLKGKMVIIQKGGRTAQGSVTAQSHTASMSGADSIFAAVVSQAGALIVNSETEFRDVVKLASMYETKRPKGPNVFVINGAGYEGVLSSDELSRSHMKLPKPDVNVAEVLQPYLGKILDSTNNPADVGPATHDSAYESAVSAALRSGIYQSALVAIMPHGNGMEGVLPPFEAEPHLLGPSLVRMCQTFSQPIVVSVNGGSQYAAFREYLESHLVPVFPEAERAAHALGLFYKLSQVTASSNY